MALWVTAILALACLGGLATPGPVPPPMALKELIEELFNITQDQKTPLCNGSMVWSVNLATEGYCAALESLTNVSNCSTIHKAQRMLSGLCVRKATAGQVSVIRDTKIEVAQFVKTLLRHSQQLYRKGQFY